MRGTRGCVLRNRLGLCGLVLGSLLGFGQTLPPNIFYSDLEAGPSQGGENNAGAYVSIYGKNFGASRGSSTVTVGGGAAASYPIWSDTKITFQLGGAAQSGNIVVVTSAGASNGVPFTVRAGNIYFISTSGSDGNGGGFTSPWRSLLKARDMPEGGIAYAMNGTSQTSEDGTGFAAAFTLGKQDCGTTPRALVAYPGAVATIGTVSGPAIAIRASSPSSRGGSCAGGWVFAGLTLRGGVGAMDLQGLIGIPTANFRIVANDMSCPNGDGATACAGTAWLNGIKMYGNNIHDAGKATASALYHGVYFGTNSNHIDFGWNTVANIHGCRGIQVHSSDGDNQFDILMHDNIIHDTQCDGIILASVDPSKGKVEIYNNLIYNAGKGPNNPEGSGGWACIQAPGYGFNNVPASGTVEIYHNTMFNCGTFPNPPYPGSIGGILAANVSPNFRVRIRNNIIHSAPGRPYLMIYKGVGALCNDNEACVALSGTNNLFFGNGPPPGTPLLTSNVSADPLFANAANADFHIPSNSPAKGAGVNTGLPYDFDGVARGASIDIGALQSVTGGGGGNPGSSSLSLTQQSVSFSATAGGANPTGSTITITNSGSAAASWTVSANQTWIVLQPTSGSVTAGGTSTFTVAANISGLAANTYTGTVTLNGGSNGPQTLAVSLTVNPPNSGVTPSISQVLNSASFVGAPMSPGEMITVLGSNFGPAVSTAASVSGDGVQTSLAGVRLLVNNAAAPILSVQSGKVIGIIPVATQGQSSAQIRIESQGVASAPTTVSISPVAPGIFTLNFAGSGQGVIVNSNGTLNGPNNPAVKGTVVSIYTNGLGVTTPAIGDGKLVTQNLLPQSNISATIGGVPATVAFSGLSVGFVTGVFRVDVVVPFDGTAGASVPVVVSANGSQSTAVTMVVQ